MSNEQLVEQTPEEQERELRNRRHMALGLLGVALVFCGVIIGVMVKAYFEDKGDPPPESVALERMRALLREHPDDEVLKDAIRGQDLELQAEYLARRRLMQTGAFMLLAGVIAALIFAKWYVSLDTSGPRPLPHSERDDEDAWQRRRRWKMVAVGAVGLLLGAGLVAMILLGGGAFPPEEVEPPEPQPVAAEDGEEPTEAPAEEEESAVRYEDNWARFRGPGGLGVVEAGDWPQSWDGESGENVVWKAPVPLPGHNSPAVWGDRVFLTGATEEAREVFCFSRTDGKLLWRTEVRTPNASEDVQVMQDTGYAAPTAATDGERVYVFFATAEMAALDFEGNVVWSRFMGEPENMYGISTSPIVHDGRVILKFDRGVMAEDGLSALLALDPETGEELWKTDRPVPNSWSTPVIAESETGLELLTAGSPWFIAYDPTTGAELWRADVLSGDIGPCPVAADGVAFCTNEYAQAAAIRMGGVGDVTESNVLWTVYDGLSDASSPLSDGEYFLQANSIGQVTCFSVETGELIWEEMLDDEFWASTTLVGDLVYLPGTSGKTHIFKLADSYELTAEPDLGEKMYATPAFGDACIYIRGVENLYCLSTKPPTEGEEE